MIRRLVAVLLVLAGATGASAQGDFVVYYRGLVTGRPLLSTGYVDFHRVEHAYRSRLEAASSGQSADLTWRLPPTYGASGACWVGDGLGNVSMVPCLIASNNLSDLASAAAARANLALTAMATMSPASVAFTGGSITGINDLALADGGTGASTAAIARTNLGVAIGQDVMAQNANLQALADLTYGANSCTYYTGVGVAATMSCTSAGRSMIGAADAAAQTALLDEFTGDSGAGGLKGLVKAPGIGDQFKFLRGDKTWQTVDTTITHGVTTRSGCVAGGISRSTSNLEDCGAGLTYASSLLGITGSLQVFTGGFLWMGNPSGTSSSGINNAGGSGVANITFRVPGATTALVIDNDGRITAVNNTSGISSTRISDTGEQFGYDSYAGALSVALGKSARAAGGGYNTAIGYNAIINAGAGAVAVGANAGAGHDHSTAIGERSVTTAANQLVLGQVTLASYHTSDFVLAGSFTESGVASPVLRLRTPTGLGTNIAGTTLSMDLGPATGSATGGDLVVRTSVQGSSGTTAQTLGDRSRILAKYTALAEATATTFARVEIPSGTVTGGVIEVVVEANDASAYQSRTILYTWSATNHAGTITGGLSTLLESEDTPTGTLTCAITLVDAGSGNLDHKADCTSSLTQTVLRANAQVRKNLGVGAISAQ